MESSGPVLPELSAEALREWTTHAESIMRGLAHALNNRAAALSAIVELAREADDDPDGTRIIVNDELQRMRDLVDVARFLGPASGEAEALSPLDVAEEALALLRLHALVGDRAIAPRDEGAPPVRVPRWMLQRALLVLCASQAGRAPATGLTLSLAAEGEWMVARLSPAADGQSAYVAELTRAMGGEPLAAGFRIPTLEALRRRGGR